MAKLEKKSFDNPDESHPAGKGKADVINLGGSVTRRLSLPVGWRWSVDVKPMAKTDSCQLPHLNVHVSGRFGAKMDDGTEKEFGPGDIGLLPPGHDAWVIGDEPVVIIEQTPSL